MKEIEIDKRILALIACFVGILIFGILWDTPFGGDKYENHYHGTELVFSGLHYAINVILGVLIAIGFAYIFIICDYEEEYQKISIMLPLIKINFKKLVYLLLILFFAIVLVKYVYTVYKGVVNVYNTNVGYIHQYNTLTEERVGFYDKMYRTYIQKYDICELNKETFIEVTKIIMDGRKDGENVSWKFVHENQNIGYTDFSRFYTDLSNFVASQREAYFDLEKQCYDVVRKNNELLDTFPNNIYSGWVDCKRIDMHQMGFTSEQTRDVFNSGIEK